MTPTVLVVVPHFLANEEECSRLLTAIHSQNVEANIKVAFIGNNPRVPVPEGVDNPPDRKVHNLGVNLGYAGAVEFARRHFPSDFVWVLQEDNLPEPDCLQALLRQFIEDKEPPPLGLVTPALKGGDASRRISSRNMATGVEYDDFDIDAALHSLRTATQSDSVFTYVPVSGALIRSSSLDSIGGLDSRLWPLGSVDADLCTRLQLSGFGISRASDAVLAHLKGFGRYDSFPFWKTIAKRRNRAFLAQNFPASAPNQLAQDNNRIPPDLLFSAMVGQTEFLFSYSEWVEELRKRRVALPRSLSQKFREFVSRKI